MPDRLVLGVKQHEVMARCSDRGPLEWGPSAGLGAASPQARPDAVIWALWSGGPPAVLGAASPQARCSDGALRSGGRLSTGQMPWWGPL